MRVREIKDAKLWDEAIESLPHSHLLQSYQWGELKAHFGWHVVRLAVEEGGEILGGAQVLLQRLPLGCLAYVPKGPCLAPDNREALSQLIASIHRLSESKAAIFTRLEPDWPAEPVLAKKLLEQGFRASRHPLQPRTTLVIDLLPPEEEILSGMKSKTRYSIRLAARKGVKVREGGEEDLAAFYRCLEETSRRDHFLIHRADYYRQAWQRFAPQGRCKFLLAYYQEEFLAGLMAFTFGGRAYYLYGASTDRHRNLMPNHLLQWEAMRWAKEKGCTTYDLWGIPDEVGEELEGDIAQIRGGLWGVYRFKQGFGGRVVRCLGAYDYVYRRMPYLVGMALWPWLGKVGRALKG